MTSAPLCDIIIYRKKGKFPANGNLENCKILSIFGGFIMEIHGYPVIQEEGFTIARGAMKPATYESYEAAKSAQEKLVGSTMTYKVSVPPAEVEEILEKRR